MPRKRQQFFPSILKWNSEATGAIAVYSKKKLSQKNTSDSDIIRKTMGMCTALPHIHQLDVVVVIYHEKKTNFSIPFTSGAWNKIIFSIEVD